MLELGSFIHEIHYDEPESRLSHWRNGLAHGINIEYQPNGSVTHLNHWRNGGRHSIDITYHLNGSIEGLRH